MNHPLPDCAVFTPPRRNFILRVLFVVFAFATVWLSQSTAQATVECWLGASGSNWSIAANWNHGNPPGWGEIAFFNASSANMNVNLDVPTNLGLWDAHGGLVFTGSAYNGSTGYTISSQTNAINMLGSNFIEISPNFVGSNITETIAAPVILNGDTYFANMTAVSTSFRSTAQISSWSGIVNPGVTESGTNNLLVLSGTITQTQGWGTMFLVGPGNGDISGNIVSGAGNSRINIYVATLGTWTLSGNNSFDPTAGSTTQVAGGTLALDFTTNNLANSKINSNSQLTLGGTQWPWYGNTGGTLKIIGATSGATSQAVNGWTLGAGASAIDVVAGSGKSAVLQLGPLNSRSWGSTIDFTLPAGTQNATNGVQTSWTNTAGSILAGYATVAQTDWAVSGATSGAAGAITALTSYTGDTWASGSNTTVTVSGTVSGASTNTLRFNSAGTSDTVTLTGNDSIDTGGILVTPNVVNPVLIAGGTLSASNEYIIQQYSAAPFTISSVLTGNRTLTKSGAGMLILSGSNALGNVYLNGGTLKVGNSYAMGSNPGTLNVANTAVFDLNGHNVAIGNLAGDAINTGHLNGSAAAQAGLTANITNSVAGTQSTLTIGNGTNFVTGGGYYGGFTEATGAILSLSLVGSGQHAGDDGALIGAQWGGLNWGNSTDNADTGFWNNTITGGVTVAKGAAWKLQGSNFNMLGALTMNGEFCVANAPSVNTTYLAGSGLMTGWGPGYFMGIDHLGSLPDVSNVRFGASCQWVVGSDLNFGGTGVVSLPTMYLSVYHNSDVFIGNTGTVVTPGIPMMGILASDVTIAGSGGLKLTGGAGSSPTNPQSILPGEMLKVNGGTVAITPAGSNQNIYVQGGFGPTWGNGDTNVTFGGGGAILLDKGANNSLTMTFGSMTPPDPNWGIGPLVFDRYSEAWNAAFGTAIIASAQGLSALGTTNRINLVAASPGSAFPTQTNGISPLWMVGQDASAGSTRQGTFLTYSYTGPNGSNTDKGFAPYVFPASSINNINGGSNTTVELVNSGTQTLTDNRSAYALQVDNATVNLNSSTLLLTGLILNGGTIGAGGYLVMNYSSALPQEMTVYTSLAGGTINSRIQGWNLTKYGPGILTLTTIGNGYSGTNLNEGVLDVGDVSSGALGYDVLRLRGGVLQGYGNFTRPLGDWGATINWTSGGNIASGGGFSAKGGSLTVTIGGGAGTNLAWGGSFDTASQVNASDFLSDGGALMFGSTNSDNYVNFTNNINLGIDEKNGWTTTCNYTRVVSVTANTTADAGLEPQGVSDYAILSGTISSTDPYHGLSKDGNGVLVLAGNNTYTGATSIANGSLLINADGNLGVAPSVPYPLSTTPGMNGGTITPGAVVINGGATLGTGATAASLTLSANRTILLASGSGTTPSNINIYNGNTLKFGGLIGDYIGELGNLGKTGGGALILSGSVANSFSGGLTIFNGLVQDDSVNNANVLGSGNVTFGPSNTPELDLNGRSAATGLLSGTTNGVITNTLAATSSMLGLSASGSQTFGGTILDGAGTVALTLSAGTQILTGANSYSGGTTLNGGLLSLGSSGAIGTSGTITFGGGILQFTSANTQDYSSRFSAAAGQVYSFDTNGQTVSLSGNLISAGGSVIKTGDGTLILRGTANAFDSGLTINGGTVKAGNRAGSAVLGSGNVSFGGSDTPTLDINGNGVTVGLLSGAGSNGGVTSSHAGAVTLSLTGSGTKVFRGSVQDGAGQVALTVNSGAQILAGVNTYSGETTVNGGSLTVTSTNALPNTSGLALGGATNGTFNFVTGTTGQTLSLQNLTMPYDGGNSFIGMELGNTINVVNALTGYRTININLFGVFGVNPDVSGTGTTYSVLTAPSSLDNFNYAVGNVYGASNFSVGVPASNNPGTGNGNIVSLTVTAAAPLTTAYWKGGFATAGNMWAISDGQGTGGNSNWTTDGATLTGLVPGGSTDVVFSGGVSQSSMTLGMNMAINSMTITDGNGIVLSDPAYTLTVNGAAGVATSGGAGAVVLKVGLMLDGVSSQALTVNNPAGMTIGGVISSGTAGITVNGSGVLTLTGANTFTGPLTLSAGTLNTATAGINGTDSTNGIIFNGGKLQAAAGGINTAKTLTMNGSGTIDTNGNDSIISGVISGGAVLTKIGDGMLTLNGSNANFTSGLTINQGTVRIAAGTSGPLCGGMLTFGGSWTPTLDLNDNAVSVGSISGNGWFGYGDNNGYIVNNALDSGTGTLAVTVTNDTWLNTALQDGLTAKVALVKSGTGRLIMDSAANTFSGGVTILDGILQGSNIANRFGTLGSGIITFGPSNTPTLDLGAFNGTVTTGLLSGGTNAVITTSADGWWTIKGPGAATFAGTIDSAGHNLGLIMASTSGSQTLTGSNNISYGMTLNGGVLNATTAAISGAYSSITFYGGTLQSGSGGLSLSKSIQMNGRGVFDATSGNDITLSGAISGNGMFEKTGPGVLNVTNSGNSFNGVLDLNGGILAGNISTLNLNDTSYAMIFTSGTLRATGGGISTPKAINLGSAASVAGIDTNGMGTATLSGVISGPGGLVKTGTDTLILSAANTFSGGLIINDGNVVGGGSQPSQFGAGNVTFGTLHTPTLDLAGTSVTVNMLSGSGTNGLITNSSATNNATLTLAGGGATQSYAGRIQNGLSSAFALVMSGTGTQILTGANTYTGVTSINGGILSTNRLANGGSASGIGQSTSNAANLVLDGGCLQYTGTGARIDRLFTLGGDNGGIDTIDASGSGPLVFTSTGVMGQTNTGHTLILTGSNTGNNTLVTAIAENNSWTAVVKSGPGKWVLTGTSSNPFTGGLTITGGILAGSGTDNASNTFGVQNEAVTFNGPGATLQATGPLVLLNGNIQMVQTGIVDTQGNIVSLYSHITTGTGNGGLIKEGSGTLILGWGAGGNDTFNGLTINNGTVGVQNTGGNFGPGLVTFGPSNTPTMDISGANAQTGLLSGGANGMVTNSSTTANTNTLTLTGTGLAIFDGVIQDNPAVSGSGGWVGVSVGGGTQVLRGANTYTGWTTSGPGQLIVSGSLVGTTLVEVKDGGILGGAGRINSATTIFVDSTGGTIAPGNLDLSGGSTEGTLTVGNLDLSAGGSNGHLAMQLGGSPAGGVTPSDRIVLGGAVNITGADLLTSLIAGYTPGNADLFFLVINGTSETGIFGSVNGVAGTYDQNSVIQVGGYDFMLSYNANYASKQFSVPGGSDIALMAVVPEPGTWALLIGGMGLVAVWKRSRRKA